MEPTSIYIIPHRPFRVPVRSDTGHPALPPDKKPPANIVGERRCKHYRLLILQVSLEVVSGVLESCMSAFRIIVPREVLVGYVSATTANPIFSGTFERRKFGLQRPQYSRKHLK